MDKHMNTPIDYACAMCDTIRRKYSASALPPEKKFHYHQGVFLSGMLNTYLVCMNEDYYQYIKTWVDSIIYPDGSINDIDHNMLDDIQPGILLFHLFKRTGDSRYINALDTLLPILKGWKRNAEGGFWHKEYHPDQMWLDSLYMAGPLMAEYATTFEKPEFLEIAIEQALIMERNMRDADKGLLYHAWDCSKKVDWADKETGLSQEFWGRALGWYIVAVLDILKFVSATHPYKEKLQNIAVNLLKSIIRFQDEKSGMWYQVVDKGECEGNWLEASCTSLFVYAIAKAVEMELIDLSHLVFAHKGYEGIINNHIAFEGENMLLSGVCVGTNVCDYSGYIARPTSVNDLHGAGAFLLMCAQMAQV